MISLKTACELAREFGAFEYADAQGDVRHDYANKVIAYHERLRAAAPELLVALRALLGAVENLGHVEGGLDGLDHLCNMTGLAYKAIANATGEPA